MKRLLVIASGLGLLFVSLLPVVSHARIAYNHNETLP